MGEKVMCLPEVRGAHVNYGFDYEESNQRLNKIGTCSFFAGHLALEGRGRLRKYASKLNMPQ